MDLDPYGCCLGIKFGPGSLRLLPRDKVWTDTKLYFSFISRGYAQRMSNLACIFSAELCGVDARVIEVEVDLHAGLHAFNIVGLADKALSEAKERVNSALKNSGVKPPNRENRKITVNLAPADVKKSGSQYDLSIALGYLLATKQIGEFDASKKLFLGELALDGRLRPMNGALNITEAAKASGFECVYLPRENANEASAIEGITVVPVDSLFQTIEILEGRRAATSHVFQSERSATRQVPDLAEIKGQENAKRALMIAAAGGHNLLFIGAPGVGKSLLAEALIGILPEISREESIETTKIWSAAGLPLGGLVSYRPFRAPHQTASPISIVGGGSEPRPGEVSLAHRGILFMDELPEFPRSVLEALRGPMESGEVHVARIRNTVVFPAKFTLVAAMNPCPCGFYGDEEKECRCAAHEVAHYQKKISGPLLDRIDLQVRVPRVALLKLRQRSSSDLESPRVKTMVEAAREVQRKRFQGRSEARTNSEMSAKETSLFAGLSKDADKFIDALASARLSPRAYYRLLKTARTIADLEGFPETGAAHLAEAFSYRLREDISG